MENLPLLGCHEWENYLDTKTFQGWLNISALIKAGTEVSMEIVKALNVMRLRWKCQELWISGLSTVSCC